MLRAGRLRPRQVVRAAGGRAAARRRLPLLVPDPDRPRRARPGALRRRAGGRPPGPPRRGPHRPAGLPLHARGGPDRPALRRVRRARHPAQLRPRRRPPENAARGRAGQGEDRRGRPHPALPDPRAGVHRARRGRWAAAAPAGPRPSRTSPRRRSAPTSSTGTAATSEAADARFRLLRGHRRPAGAGPEPAHARLRRRPRRWSGLRPPSRTGTRSARPGCTQEILVSWLAHESRRASGGPGAAPGLDTATLWQAVTPLAMALWERRRDVAAARRARRGRRRAHRAHRGHALAAAARARRRQRAACWCAPRRGCSGSSTRRSIEWLVAEAIAAEFDAGSPRPPRWPARPPAPARRRLPLRHRRHAGLRGTGPPERLATRAARSPRNARRGARPARRPGLGRTCAAPHCAAPTCPTATSPTSTSPAPT